MTQPSSFSKHNEFVFPIRVYIEDTDAGGIVYYVNYLKFMERGRTEFMRSLGFEQQLNQSSEQQFVVHSADVKFLKPARMDMKIHVSLAIERLAKSYFVVQQKVFAEDGGDVFCEATIKVACVGNKTFKPQAMPAFVHQSLQSYLENQLKL